MGKNRRRKERRRIWERDVREGIEEVNERREEKKRSNEMIEKEKRRRDGRRLL